MIGWVYPRVGGGNGVQHGFLEVVDGLSPRGRGKPTSRWTPTTWLGSIPAWAGETFDSSLGSARQTVYPRVGGGNVRLHGGAGML